MEEGRYFINGKDAYLTYGLVFMKGTYAELLKFPKKKDVLSKNWSDQNGTQRFFPGTPFYESIDYKLPVVHSGLNEADFYAKYSATRDLMMTTPGYLDFDVSEMNRRFRLLYNDMTSFDRLTLIHGIGEVYCTSTLYFTNDFPTITTPLIP